MWVIKMQEEGIKDARHEVACKLMDCIPIKNKKTKVVTFGRTKTPVLCVKITNGNEEHKITWSNKQHQKMGEPSPGKFIYHWSPKWVYPTYTVGQGKRRRVCEDTLSPKVLKETTPPKEFECHNQFWVWLIEQPFIGPGLANEIQSAFIERLVEIAEKADKAETELKKAA